MSDIPEKLGKFIIEAELGKGAMGVVYKAMDPFINRTVALKTICKDLLIEQEQGTKQTETIIIRFKQEAQAAGLLNHPNIVSVYEYGEDQDTAFIAMEFVQGRSLKEIFDRNERFDMNATIKIMSQILGGLAHSHNHGIVHRDIKPANVIVMPDGQVKIMDFGIAHVKSSDLTQTGTMLGTPNYMSPEQFMGQIVDGRSDLFSAGIIFYQLVTGENPFDGRTMATVMHKVLSQEPLDPFKLNYQVSPELNRVIKQALAKKPDDRFPTAEGFRQGIIEAFEANPTVNKYQSPEAVDDNSKTVILSELITQKGEGALSGMPELPYNPYETFFVAQPEAEMGASISSQCLLPKSEAFNRFTMFPSLFKWAIICGIISVLAIGLFFNIDRSKGDKNNVITNIQDSHTPIQIPKAPPDTVEEKTGMIKDEASLATKTLTVQPPAVKTPETKTSAAEKALSSEPAKKKPLEKKVPENKNIVVVAEPPSSPLATDVLDTQEEFKDKSGAAMKDTPASPISKPKTYSCKDIYITISLGKKLSAEEQRIINKCQ